MEISWCQATSNLPPGRVMPLNIASRCCRKMKLASVALIGVAGGQD